MVLKVGGLVGCKEERVTIIFRAFESEAMNKYGLDLETVRKEMVGIVRQYAVERMGFNTADEGKKYEILGVVISGEDSEK